MTRGTMRAILQRQLNDEVGGDWSETELNDLLNVGCSMTQKDIIKLYPEAFVFIDETTDIVASRTYYPLPQGLWHIVEVEQMDSSGNWTTLPPRDYHIAKQAFLDGDETTVAYSRRGRNIRIWPQPDADLASGLRLAYTPTLTMAVDSDVPDIPIPLHIAIVLWAKRIAIGETSEASAPVREALQDILSDLGLYYRDTTLGKPVVPDITGV